MVREIISLGVGQCGVQLGYETWLQYCAEHTISAQGTYSNFEKMGPSKGIPDDTFRCLFEETGSGLYVPRNLFIDLEPNVIDDVKRSKYQAIFNPEFLINGKEDAANNFARGHYTVGKQMIDIFTDRMRKLADVCDNLQGFMLLHSVGGGTGSGLGSLILERLAVDYRKKSKLGFHVYPSPTLSTCVVEPYNALLTTHWLLDHIETSLVLDNEGIYEICQRKLDIRRPSYDNINRLVTKVLSTMTASLRFEGQLNVDLNEFQTNLVPFPRLHFMIASMAPIMTAKTKETTRCDAQGISEAITNPQNFFVKCVDFDAEEDKYMAISFNYRGNVKAKEAEAVIQWLKTNKKVSFVEWCPTGFKVGLNETVPAIAENDDIVASKMHATMISNNTCISRLFSERISKKYDVMYAQRSFVHWFVGEGMEEGEFAEAREDLGFLEKDYLDVLSEAATEDYDNDED